MVAEFELKDKEQKMFKGFEKGTRYKVEEIFKDEEGNEFTTTVSYDVYDDEGKVIEHKTDTSTSHEGALTQDDEVLVFTNTRTETGSLKIKKNVTVNGEATTGTEADGDYIFEVKDAEGTVVATKTITITNGASKEVQVDELVPGTYTVSEDTSKLPEGKGMVLVGDNDIEIEVAAGETAEVPTAEFTNNKPGTPGFEKKIQDTNDSTGETSDWQDSADYDIGDAVPFKLTATLPKDVSTNENYSIKFEDRMESTLTFVKVSKVTLNGADITKECTAKPTSGGQTFTVSKSWTGDAVTDALNGATVVVYFTATLNKNAKIGSEGNVNAARLHYDNKAEITEDSGKTPWDYVIAFTYKVDINKVDQDGNALEGAEFKLEKKLANETTTEITLSKESNVFTGTGLDDGDYVLTETTVPAGHKPIDPIEFTVTADHHVTWNYISTGDAPAFNGEGRTAILTALTGETKSGDLEFDEEESSLDGLVGNVANEELGSLKIKKNVLVNGNPTTGTSADGTYTFVIRNEDGEEVTTAEVTITNGTSNTVQVDGLAAGTYKVSEDTTKNPEGMTITGSNEVEVTVTAGNTSEIPTAEFTNDKTEVGSLKIKKNVTVNGKATTKTIADGTYTFKVTDVGENVKATETITITKGASNEVQIDNLPTGTYTVSEDTSHNPEGMSIVGDNEIEVEVTADATTELPTAEFTNNIDTGSLKIKKNVTVNGAATTGTEADGDYSFEVKDAEGTVVATKTITITNGASNEVQVDELVPGTYTVSEDTSKFPEGREWSWLETTISRLKSLQERPLRSRQPSSPTTNPVPLNSRRRSRIPMTLQARRAAGRTAPTMTSAMLFLTS